MKWLLEHDTFERLNSAHFKDFVPTESQQARFDAFLDVESGGLPENVYKVVGDQAHININGVLTAKPDILAYIFGGGNTVYSDIIAAIDRANSDGIVKSIVMHVDSPGGTISGLFETADAIAGSDKPVQALVGSMAASAAYTLASQASEIVASSRGAILGSVGVIRDIYVSDSVVTVSSTKAPNKAPDIKTDEGKAAVKSELDEMHDMLASAIASGRGVSVETVNSTYGKGGIMLAEKALSAGMIDSILASEKKSPIKGVNNNNNKTEAKSMDLDILKAQHPDVYAQAKQEGIEAERDRVSAHLIRGESYGAMDIASKAIKDGSKMTEQLKAQYETASFNKKNLEERAADDQNAGDNAQGEPSANVDQEAESLAVVNSAIEMAFGKGA